MGKFTSTLIYVGLAVAISLAIWVGANFLISQVTKNYRRFLALSLGMTGAGVAAVLAGNRSLTSLGSPFDGGPLKLLAWAVIAGAVGATTGFLLGSTEKRTDRLAIGGACGTLVAIGLGATLAETARPALGWIVLLVCCVAAGAAAASVLALLGRSAAVGAVFGVSLGGVVGGFGLPELGSGSIAESIVAAGAVAVPLGVRLGLGDLPSPARRIELERTLRATVFVGPALFFVFAALVVPTIRTLYLSLLDSNSEDWVWFDNYTSVFTNPKSLDLEGWAGIFTSRLFFAAIALVVVAVAIAAVQGRQIGLPIAWNPTSRLPVVAAIIFAVFAVFSSIRGTIPNNAWWVFTVTGASTGLGLLIAVLAERSKAERIAKSIIFMPMAISFVGASIIWRFMYTARDVRRPQTGVMNALWVGLGRLSTGDGLPTVIVSLVLMVALLGLAVALVRKLVTRTTGGVGSLTIALGLLGWFSFRFLGSSGVGGVTVGDDGIASPNIVLFVQEGPFNNFWLMVILIWIQTGFAMVILSAAIRAVPEELIEAASIDGASDSDTFWNVTLPHIVPTIGVVVTTLIVLVMKVFDIVKVITNGQFGTQVVANNMYAEAFQFSNTGVGSALAMILFLSVLPVMVSNIRSMQRQKAEKG